MEGEAKMQSIVITWYCAQLRGPAQKNMDVLFYDESNI